MGEIIENRAIGCNFCGYGPNNGREIHTKIHEGIHREIRWACERCGRLLRVDEEVINEDKK